MRVTLAKGEDVIDGLLLCPCGKKYPIINSIPRILPDFLNSKSKHSFEQKQAWTGRSFGYQWSIFKSMSDKFEGNFLNYIYPIEEDFFKGKLGLDAGCGFGRHIFYSAQFGAEMVGIDISAAIDSAYQNTKHLSGVHLVQCDIYNLPFRPETFDFAYSIGVLHHLPDPEIGFRNLTKYVRRESAVFIWVYSKKRKFTNTVIEAIRRFTPHLPLKVILFISYVMASLEWIFLILPYRLIQVMKIPHTFLEKIVLARIRLYAEYPFQISCADWFDRLSPPIRFYYNAEEVRQWFQNLNMSNIKVSETGLYGWRGYGEKRE